MALSILVADDDEIHRIMLCRRLAAHGLRPIEAEDGAEVVATLQNCAVQGGGIDIVLLDLCMPRLDGLEAWRLVLDMVMHPPPVIALTSVALWDIDMICRELGFSAVITKPARMEDILSAIAQAAPRKAAA